MAHWLYYNPNPSRNRVDDCVIRAICAATGADWKDVHAELAALSYTMDDIQIGNSVWRAYMLRHGFRLHAIDNSCPDCYTVGNFADDHPKGVYVLGTGQHAVTIVDSCVLDNWDSRECCPIYFYSKEE
jgi:hypothetical protein